MRFDSQTVDRQHQLHATRDRAWIGEGGRVKGRVAETSDACVMRELEGM